jgi:hypothetical protein
MDERNELKITTHEGIDACRAQHDDLRLPELADVARAVIEDPIVAERLERVRRCDLALGGAIQTVEVPSGLADRILNRLQSTQAAPMQDNATVALQDSSEANSIKRSHPNRLIWSLAVAASLLIGASLTVAWVSKTDAPVDVVALADVWQTKLTSEWRPMSAMPKSLSIPRGLSMMPHKWQPAPKQTGYQGAVYDLSRPGRRAILFVVDVSSVSSLPFAPPPVPQFSSGGRTVAGWMSGNRLCVLVIDGDERAYRSLINTGQAPLA